MNAPSEKTLRVAMLVGAELAAGADHGDAVRKVAAGLEVSPAAVAYAAATVARYLDDEYLETLSEAPELER